MNDPKQLLNEFMEGLQSFEDEAPEQTQAFMNLLGASYKDEALSNKTKELISVAIGAYNRCEYCIAFHVYKALEAGATKEEIYESAMVSVAFGGGPSMAYSVTLVKKSVEAFLPEFQS
ncbi:carboxymuconolactone decarboxylase family protein [Natranaerobius thermophilus JW/NM-WN-LF]|uniref:Alkylhydroperoxidase like protein, AhpD family n=2 Tax=Natranaerobius TaxID=375928 RepID=B2A7X2_NATTJ|nr:carboxymuconolactone decarboxylase family protein [Natranaerobius thermophilus]ACB85744.1 alkylhydroperoxidase like protein, AhpD family [Natranaerobius thermophilus JW/NM-WN-LF]